MATITISRNPGTPKGERVLSSANFEVWRETEEVGKGERYFTIYAQGQAIFSFKSKHIPELTEIFMSLPTE